MARGYATLYGFNAANVAVDAGLVAPGKRIGGIGGGLLDSLTSVVEDIPDAYAAYGAGGGGVEGALASLVGIDKKEELGTKPIPGQGVVPTASTVAASDAVKATAEEGGWGLGIGSVIGIAAIGGLVWYVTRKKKS